MTIEIANRLIAYRKQNGFSQEELAEKIGVSRQAVSKWERAEASPDTDNLILLSKIYGITLDELVNADPDISTENNCDCDEESEETQDSISFKNGIHINSRKGDKVDIDFSGIHVEDRKGDTVHIGLNGIHVEEDGHIHFTNTGTEPTIYDEERQKLKRFHRFPFAVLCVILYLLMGFFNVLGGWAYGWLILLTIPLYYTTLDAIIKKKPQHFCYPVLCLLVFFILGFYLGLWHPSWIIFVTIPLFYGSFVEKTEDNDYDIDI